MFLGNMEGVHIWGTQIWEKNILMIPGMKSIPLSNFQERNIIDVFRCGENVQKSGNGTVGRALAWHVFSMG